MPDYEYYNVNKLCMLNTLNIKRLINANKSIFESYGSKNNGSKITNEQFIDGFETAKEDSNPNTLNNNIEDEPSTVLNFNMNGNFNHTNRSTNNSDKDQINNPYEFTILMDKMDNDELNKMHNMMLNVNDNNELNQVNKNPSLEIPKLNMKKTSLSEIMEEESLGNSRTCFLTVRNELDDGF